MNYGVPYMGSKNKLAERIVRMLPRAEVLVDAFAGGCAVTHAALISGKFGRVIANDISDAPSLFLDAMNGKFAHEERWISREEFHELRLTDPYVRLCWSFGSKGTTYIYGKEIEAYKHAVHKMVYARTPYERTLAFREVGDELGKLLQLGQTTDVPTVLENVQRLARLQNIQSLQRLNRIQSLAGQAQPDKLQVVRGAYQDIAIPDNAVIYCDPPYANTEGYNGEKFDSASFYEWCKRQTAPLFISEYWMPEADFACIAEFSHTKTVCATECTPSIERVFRPRHQVEGIAAIAYQAEPNIPSLFPDIRAQLPDKAS